MLYIIVNVFNILESKGILQHLLYNFLITYKYQYNLAFFTL